MILDHRGEPVEAVEPSRRSLAATGEDVLKAFTSYTTAVANLRVPALQRARDPFGNNAWVYACAVATALNASAVPYGVMRETDIEQERRISKAKQMKRWEGAFPSGRRRRAVQRHLSQGCRRWGITPRGLEHDYEHHLNDVFMRPNSLMSSMQMWFLTDLWHALKGEAFWLLLDDQMKPTSYFGGNVRHIWPVNPDYFTEVVEGNQLVAWELRIGRGTAFESEGWQFKVLPDEVVHFYCPDPQNPLRGLNPLAAAAAHIFLDALATQHNIGMISTGGQPAGVLFHEGPQKPFKNKGEEEEFREKWHQRHSGVDREKGVALLTGGWKYVQVGLSQKDMDFLNMGEMDRDVILAVMRTPKSVLSITDDLNFATQMSQDRNFWDKNLMPMQSGQEQTLDATLLWPEDDTVVGLFDRSKVEALKVGIAEKVTTMNTLTAAGIHMPPKQAAELVGLDLPGYDGDDIALAGAVSSVSDLIDGGEKAPAQPATGTPGQPPPPPGGTPPKPDAALPTPVGGGNFPMDKQLEHGYNAPAGVAKVNTSQRRKRWARLMRTVQQPFEQKFTRSWRRFVSVHKAEQLARFDRAAREIKAALPDIGLLLADLGKMKQQLRQQFRPIYEAELEAVFEQTVAEIGGVAVFELDDPDIVAALDRREQIVVGSAPETLQENLRASLRRGLENGESIQQMRLRVARVYDVAASSGKALTVARTESAGFMNDAREAMFKKQGFEKRQWLTALDEHVRPAHRRLGALGPQPEGTNLLELIGEPGVLEFPGDFRAPAKQVINCRCVHVPA